jgi:hypothetical protein
VPYSYTPRKRFKGIWMSIGALIGVACGAISDELAVCLTLGLALGAAFDSAVYFRARRGA